LVREIGVAVDRADIVPFAELSRQILGFLPVTKAVEHDIGASPGKSAGNAEADAACRTCHNGSFARQHRSPPISALPSEILSTTV